MASGTRDESTLPPQASGSPVAARSRRPLVIDFHAHVQDGDDGAWADRLVAEARRVGIDYVCISEPLVGNGFPIEEVRRQNDLVFRMFQRYPDYFVPLVYTHPELGAPALDEVRRGFDRGARGVKLEISCLITERCVEPIVEECLARDVPLLQHSWHKVTGNYPYESDPVHCAEVGRRYPELKLVMAHIGGDSRWGARAIRDVPNVHTDCSGSIADFGSMEAVVAMLGADRLLWGTDVRGADYLYTLAKVRDSDLSAADKAKVLGLNAARLLKIPV